MKFSRLTILIFFLNALAGFGQNESCRKTTEGTEFWFGFMEGRNYQVGHYCEVTLSSSFSCNYKIYIGKSVNPSYSGTVAPNIPVKVKVDWTQVEATGSENIQEKAIHLVSDQPLNVYALNWSPNSSEVAMIFPVKSLGNEYYTMCYYPHINGNGINAGNGRNSEFLIVASEDNTLIHINPAKVTDKGKPANTTYSVVLNKGELYQVQSENLPVPKYPGQGDLTGSYILSDKPIALFSGSLSTTIPADASVSAWDHLYEQMPPLQTWGRKFVAVPLKTRHEDSYRVMASEDHTTVRVGNKTPFVLNKGRFSEFMLLNTEPSLIESDKPVLLAQLSNSNSVDSKYNGGDGDPFMVIVSPVNQTREKVAFVAYDSPEITSKFFINVVVKDDVIGMIKLDNTVIPFTAINGSGYSYSQVSIAKGNHYIESTGPGKGFIAYVYGFGGVEAYGYGVGYNLDIVLDLGSNINVSGDKLLIRCDGITSLNLNAGNGFDSYLWSTGETSSSINVSEEGTYSVTASTIEGCKLTDEIRLQYSKPVVDLGPDLTICSPGTAVLDAGDQFIGYLWSTAQTDKKITISKTGTYSVEVTDKYGCKAKDQVKASFIDKPSIDLKSLEKLICGDSKTAQLSIKTNATVYTLESVNQQAEVNGLHVSVPDFGIYPMVFKANVQSCTNSENFDLAFYKKPVLDLGPDTTICNPGSIVLNAGDQFVNYLWSTKENAKSIIVIKDGVYDVLVTDKNGCKTSDEIKIAFTSKPKLDLSKLETLICGDFETNINISADKNVTWLLESKDPKVNIRGLTVSVSPVDIGIYTVTATATDQFSCSSGTTFSLGFYQKPTVNLGSDSTICNPGSIELKAGDQFAHYLWSTNDSTKSIIVKKEGIYKVDVIDKKGCKTDDEIKINFTNKPKLDLSRLETLICGDFSATLNVSADKNVTWSLESKNPGIYFDDLKVSVTPDNSGIYPVTLTATDDYSCSSGATFNLRFYQSPNLDLGPDTTICDRDKFELFAGNQFTRYLWSTSDTTKSITAKNNGVYGVTVIDKNGCKKSDDIILAFAHKPKLDLSRVETLFCGKFATTLDVSADKNVSWLLESNDPKVKISGLKVSVSPSDPGTYPVILTATDDLSCFASTSFNFGFYPIPFLELGHDSIICNHVDFELSAGDQFAGYSWSTKDTTNSIIVNKNGRYVVWITDKNGCKTSDSINILFNSKPVLNLSRLDTLICGRLKDLLNVTSDKGTITVQRLFDDYIFKGTDVAVPEFGTYQFRIKSTDEFSCYADSVIKLGFHKTPKIDFSVDSTHCYHYNLDVRYFGDANVDASDFIWIFGGDTIKHGVGINSYIVPLGIDRATRNLKLIVSDQGCSNEKTLTDIKVMPNLKMWVTDSLGCEPFTTKFMANNTETVTYSWDFGDGNILSGSTSDPSHTYENAGYYPVKLLVATDKGCTNEIVVDSIVHVAPIPSAGFNLSGEYCLNKGVNEIYYSGSGNIRDKYFWDLKAFEMSEIIKDPLQTQGPFKFDLITKPAAQIGLKVISEFGCGSLPAVILVKRKPDFSINISSNAGCPPFKPIFTARTGDKVDQVKYSWNFGDGTNGSGEKISHEYAVADHKYDILINALSSTTGCTDTLNRKAYVWVYPKPTTGFSALPANCLGKGNHPISYKGTGDNLDTYNWDLSMFDNEEIIQNPNGTQGPLIFNLRNKPKASIGLNVVSKFGCKSDTATIVVKRKPDFSMNSTPNAGCTPFETIFTARTGDPVDQVKYSWNFGDGTSGKGDEIKHEYSEPDHKYNVVLNALSSVTGCSDTLFRKELVWAYPKPKASFSMDNKVVYNDKPTVRFFNSSTGANIYSWSFGDGSFSNLKDPSHYYNVTGYRTVLLEVSDDYHCTDTVTHRLLVAFYRIYPPNAFSPVAPNAIDREFKLGAEGISAEGYHFIIINRWNDVVFETRDEIKGWDGRMPDGVFVPASTYVWILDFVDFLGRKHRQTGTVTVVY